MQMQMQMQMQMPLALSGRRQLDWKWALQA